LHVRLFGKEIVEVKAFTSDDDMI